LVSDTVLEHFSTIQSRTECFYARSAHLRGAPTWRDDLSLEANAQRLFSCFQETFKRDATEKYDGLVFEICSTSYGTTLQALASTTKRLLFSLSELNLDHDCLDRFVTKPGWWFTLCGTRLFVSAFAPCYPASNSRYGFGSQSTFFLFLTEESFNARRPPRAATLPEHVRQYIRVAYDNSGRPYDLGITRGPLEAFRYVKPTRLGDLPIAWWLADSPPHDEG
jgi:hypothetical protein